MSKANEAVEMIKENRTVMHHSPRVKKPMDYREPSEWNAIIPARALETTD